MEIEGEGSPAILFIHNAGGCKEIYFNQRNLSSEFKCIFVDLPGHGLDPHPHSGPLTLDFAAEALGEVLAKLQLQHVVLVGLNVGANVAFQLAIKAPKIIKGIMAIEPPCFMSSSFINELRTHVEELESNAKKEHIHNLIETMIPSAKLSIKRTLEKAFSKVDIVNLKSLYEDLIFQDEHLPRILEKLHANVHLILSDIQFCPAEKFKLYAPTTTVNHISKSLCWPPVDAPDQINHQIKLFAESKS